MKTYKSSNFASIYKKLLTDLRHKPDHICQPRDQKINELMNVSLSLENPFNSMYENEKRSSQFKYIAAETVWYFSGSNDPEFILPYAKFWDSIRNEDGTVNSAYGETLFSDWTTKANISQYSWAIKSLIVDTDSRQAVMHFNKPKHQFFGNKDFVCTMYGIFHIRDNKLNFTVHMRSNDAILGLATDVAFFTILQQQALSHLKQQKYPDLEMGRYIHQVDSMHLYERNFKVVDEMLQKDFKPAKKWPKLTHDYITPDGSPTDEFNKLKEYIDTVDGDGKKRFKSKLSKHISNLVHTQKVVLA